jgi:hypothetical protein
MIRNRNARIAVRRAEALERARQVLPEIADGSLDACEGYRLPQSSLRKNGEALKPSGDIR